MHRYSTCNQGHSKDRRWSYFQVSSWQWAGGCLGTILWEFWVALMYKTPDFYLLICASSAKALCTICENDTWQGTFSILRLTNINWGMETWACKNGEADYWTGSISWGTKGNRAHFIWNCIQCLTAREGTNYYHSRVQLKEKRHDFLLWTYIYMGLCLFLCSRLWEGFSPQGY